MPQVSVIIADDHQVVRAGLRQIIASQPDLRVVADCRTGKEVIAALKEQVCNVLLLDLSLPDMSGLDVLKHVRTHHEGVTVLVLSGYPERQFGINVLRGGAHGFLSKSADESELLRAVRMVARGSRYVGPELADLLLASMDGSGEQPRHGILSEREFQIFVKLAEGKTVTEIAGKLFLSVKTVSTYRSRILDKMGMKTNADITYYAIKNSLLQ
ncbi:MAG TPA: response regulator transcription factor [Steroidobacteraceae bacterium]|nr:response regulator transcription factor [Steroidobacteraceae bacterium]HQW07718.1 response regulator transcription factor [Steroidobacteraceae bacterium]HQX45905.1 response regulator transcription factor [Steroidobacteraceae bacterium]HQX78610.1 response regulator transcription factor [Steroidobacteraceae bacterium]HQZ80459.1 response regulator transcription factor [Steroidobacteraceae bacterium]